MYKISLTEGLKNINKNKALTYLTVLLFSFLFLMQGYTYSYYAVSQSRSQIGEHEDFSNYKIYRTTPSMDLFMIYLENNFGHELPAETMEYIENLNNIEHLKYVTEYFDSIEILDFKGDPMIFQHPLKIDDLLEKGVHAFNAVSVSPNFHKMESYRVVKGRDFTDEDMPYIQGKPRPVLVGYKYMDYYDVGDILSIPGCMTYSDLVTEL